MADTIRTINDLLTALFQDGQAEGSISAQDVRDLIVSLGNIYEMSNTTGFRDLTSSIAAAVPPGVNAPTWTAFTPGGAGNQSAYAFALNDYVWIDPFHVNHEVKANANAYFHLHWTTNGTSTATTKWEIEYTLAKGHQQQAFSTPQTITVEQAGSGTAYYHMIIESATPITLAEPDILILARVKRITNGGTDNADTVFGLFVDLHFEADRFATKNKSPDFNT